MDEKIREEVDSNKDNLIDIWKVYRKGKPFELQADTNFDRRRDVWGLYGKDGNLTTYRADTDFDGRIDFERRYPFRQK